MDTQIDILHKHRVETFEEKQTGSGLRFERMKIRFADGSLFYDGWIQDLGLNSGPTVFDANYNNHQLEYEDTFEHAKFEVTLSMDDVGIRAATESDIEDIIDLRFHNYADDYYHRISAFQALNHRIDDSHFTWVVELGSLIIGHIYYEVKHPEEAYLDDLFIHPEFRGNRFATYLLQVSFELLKNMNIEKIQLKIIGNPEQCEDAARLYDRLGFVVENCGDEPGEFISAIMIKNLIPEQ